MIRIRPERARIELNEVIDILNDWKETLSGGVPGEESAASELNVEIFEMRFKAELQLVAARLFALSEGIE